MVTPFNYPADKLPDEQHTNCGIKPVHCCPQHAGTHSLWAHLTHSTSHQSQSSVRSRHTAGV